MNNIYFISGVNGVGKTSIMPYLEKELGTKFVIHDFDERGVPENADTAWRIAETKYWRDEGTKLACLNKNMVICGFVKPADFESGLKNKNQNIILILLDAQPEIIRQRLINRYTVNGYFDKAQKVIGKSLEEFIGGNLYILAQMKAVFKELDCPIINTSNLSPEEVARAVAALILK